MNFVTFPSSKRVTVRTHVYLSSIQFSLTISLDFQIRLCLDTRGAIPLGVRVLVFVLACLFVPYTSAFCKPRFEDPDVLPFGESTITPEPGKTSTFDWKQNFGTLTFDRAPCRSLLSRP